MNDGLLAALCLSRPAELLAASLRFACHGAAEGFPIELG